jgi:hypothetical protein
VKKRLGTSKLLAILTLVASNVIVRDISDATGLIVEIDRVNVATSMTALRSPKIEETMEEISFTTLFVANAPKLTGE